MGVFFFNFIEVIVYAGLLTPENCLHGDSFFAGNG